MQRGHWCQTFEFKPLSSARGAEIGGADLANPLVSLSRLGRIFFREQGLTSEQHIALARR